ncbi:hypothetical protein CPB83DRAFT_858079 [Crepidotus variabilis]|uniref:Uncharacterized protein n=1 Tax=Crepidotus variabilis TaxID=179855 RepID=A0A9P6JMX5_9AGAR|nr:hypothetical protein CPB83DRAFT_858079 [Crepidotus variabilis]
MVVDMVADTLPKQVTCRPLLRSLAWVQEERWLSQAVLDYLEASLSQMRLTTCKIMPMTKGLLTVTITVTAVTLATFDLDTFIHYFYYLTWSL